MIAMDKSLGLIVKWINNLRNYFSNKLPFSRCFPSWEDQSEQKTVKIGRKYVGITILSAMKFIVLQAFKNNIINDKLGAKKGKISKDGILLIASDVTK